MCVYDDYKHESSDGYSRDVCLSIKRYTDYYIAFLKINYLPGARYTFELNNWLGRASQ